MTKTDIELIIRRYAYIKRGIKEHKEEISFYIGKRKYTIMITKEVKEVFYIIEDIQQNLEDDWLYKMVQGILAGKSDIGLISILPCERSMYYRWKERFIQTVYRCCIAKQMIGYEELLKEGIA